MIEGFDLRALMIGDIEELFQLIIKNRERLSKWLPWLNDSYSYTDTGLYIRKSQEQHSALGIFQAGIWLNGRLVGCVGFRNFVPSHRSIGLGYWLDQDHEGRGIMTHAVTTMISYAFGSLHINRLEICCALENTRSRAIPERIGFVQEGILRQAEWIHDKPVDVVVYSMIAQREELQIAQYEVDSKPTIQFPMAPKKNGTWDRQDHYILALDNPWYHTIAEILNVISWSTSAFFLNREMMTLQLPITTNSISSPMGLGSDSKPVQVNLMGIDTYLADSMQFMLEYGIRLTQKGCYYLMPSFRGEDVDHRHLSQFYHSEAEIFGSLDDVIRLVESYLLQLTYDVVAQCGERIQAFTGTLAHVNAMLKLSTGFPRLKFSEAADLLNQEPQYITTHSLGFRCLTNKGEVELIRRFGGFVWITHFDYLSVPFYQAFAEDLTAALAADLLFGLGETVGAGERHTTEDQVRQALDMHNVDSEPYAWYLQMKALRPQRTAGFGLGIERYLCWILQHNDIRDCQILPRFNYQRSVP